MSDLSQQYVNKTYAGLLQIPGGITSELQTVQDGNGNSTGLQISDTGINAVKEIEIGPTITGTPGSAASVVNAGTSTQPIFQFTIPSGASGLSVASAAMLRGVADPVTQVVVQTQGCLAAGDGGGGVWRWDSASSATDNTGTVLLPTGHVGNGRWLRVYDGALNALWFGTTSTALQTAIDTLAAGQTLQLPKADYSIAAAGLAISSRSRLRIIGDPGARFVFAANSTQNPANTGFGPTAAVLLENSSDIEVSGIEFVPSGYLGACVAVVSCTHVKLHHLVANAVSALAAIGLANQCSYVDIAYCRITNGTTWGSPAIATRGLWLGDFHYPEDTHISVHHCQVTGNAATGIASAALGHSQITHNYVRDNGGSGVVVAGTQLRTTHDLIVANNTFIDNLFHSVQSDVQDADEPFEASYPYRINVTGNTSYISSAEHMGSHVYAIRCFGWVIANNLMRGSRYGVFVGNKVHNVVVSSNYFDRQVTTGVQIVAQVGNVADVLVSANQINCLGNTQDGIAVLQVAGAFTIDQVTLSGNHIRDATRYGIIVAEATAGTVTNVGVFGNTAKASGTTDFRCTNVLDVDASGNNFTTTVGVPLELTSATPAFSLRKQYLLHNSAPLTVTNFVATKAEAWAPYYVTTKSTNITIQHNTNILLKGAADVNLPNGGIMTFMYTGVHWVELYRNF